ncbi:hypothetical protein HZH68_004295 [Vespula germanica]|uniref:Uncharacterized protein n=1 Tax=Vespula germanica TaxID=30212 RepID=A0A834KL08_VESGE|nr:hypothetical protein HZH68_004295 [Vespula germanica]
MALSRFRVHPGGASLVRRKIKNERLDRRKRWMESEKEIDRGRNKESLGAGALGFLFAHYLLAWMHRPLCCVDYAGSGGVGKCSLSKAKTDEDDDDDEVLGSGSSKFERARLKEERGCLRANLAELRSVAFERVKLWTYKEERLFLQNLFLMGNTNYMMVLSKPENIMAKANQSDDTVLPFGRRSSVEIPCTGCWNVSGPAGNGTFRRTDILCIPGGPTLSI